VRKAPPVLAEPDMNAAPSPSPWQLAARTARMNPSAIREILKLTELPGIISLAGGLPSALTFPVEAVRDATARVLRETPREALQYAASEGFAPLREWVAAEMTGQGLTTSAAQVLITTGSQQGLDLIGKVLIDAGSRVAVESPTYLGALQAFVAYQPEFVAIDGDDGGPLAEALTGAAAGARFAYLLPNFQNPSGRSIAAPRRAAIAAAAARAGVPIVEDNPYGDLWYDVAPPAPMASHWREGSIYLGSFSKVLAPGLRLGYVIAPDPVFAKLVQAKQAADLHTPGFNQRIVHEIVRNGFLDAHVPTIRSRYRAQRDAMQAALLAHLPSEGPLACRWQMPGGGMFFWVELPEGIDSEALLVQAVARGVAFVPGAPFFAGAARRNTLRLSFVTVDPESIARGIAALAAALRDLHDEALPPRARGNHPHVEATR
jgi:2-aminoadipate transaminase